MGWEGASVTMTLASVGPIVARRIVDHQEENATTANAYALMEKASGRTAVRRTAVQTENA